MQVIDLTNEVEVIEFEETVMQLDFEDAEFVDLSDEVEVIIL